MKKQNHIWVPVAAALVCIALLYILDLVLPSGHMLFTVLKKSSIYALVAVSMNLLNGFTGLFSLGQAGFMLIGAYAYAIFTIPVEAKEKVYQYYDCIIGFSLPIPVALVLAGLLAAVFAWLIGLPVLRLKSDYLAIATLGFAEIIKAVFLWKPLGPVTNGSNLLKSFPTFSTLISEDSPFYGFYSQHIAFFSTLFPLAVAAICITVIVLLINSSYGRAFKAIREDEIAAEAMGINLFRHKQLSFCISSFFAPKKPPPFVPTCLIASSAAIGPAAMSCHLPSSVETVKFAWKFWGVPCQIRSIPAIKERGIRILVVFLTISS